MKLPPIKFNLLGGDFSFKYQNILGGIVILLVLGYQLSNRGGVTQIALPESANQKLINDLQNVSEASGEKAIADTQFSGLVPDGTDLVATKKAAQEVIASSDDLHAAAQLLLYALVKERQDEIVESFKDQQNNPKNEYCFAAKWQTADCLRSLLANRRVEWEKVKSTPSKQDDQVFANEQMSFALTVLSITSNQLDVKSDLLNVYSSQLTSNELTIDSASALATMSNTMLKLDESLSRLQTAKGNSIASLEGRTQEQYECLNSGVINAETAKKCGVKPE